MSATVPSLVLLMNAVENLRAALHTQPVNEVAAPFSPGKVFTFLFLAIGPVKVFGPFAELTRDRDNAFKRRLAIRATILAALGLLIAGTTGAKTLVTWGVSLGALYLTAGIILFLVAIKSVLEQFDHHNMQPGHPSLPHSRDVAPAKLAMSPLAFPIVVTPWGIALIILLVTLRAERIPDIVAITAAVLVLDLLAMLTADRILRTPLVGTTLAILAVVIGVLQVALGVDVAAQGIRTLGFAGP